MGKAPPVLSLLRIDLGLSLVMAGWVLSATSILGAFTAPAAALHGAVVHAPTPELVTTSQGLLLQGGQLGLLPGPPIVAAVVSRTGLWQSASWVLMAAALLVVALSFGLGAVEGRRGIE